MIIKIFVASIISLLSSTVHGDRAELETLEFADGAILHTEGR